LRYEGSSILIRVLYEGFARLQQADIDAVDSAAADVEDEVDGLECEHGHEVEVDLLVLLSIIYKERRSGSVTPSTQHNPVSSVFWRL